MAPLCEIDLWNCVSLGVCSQGEVSAQRKSEVAVARKAQEEAAKVEMLRCEALLYHTSV